MQRVIRDYYKQLYTNKMDNLEDMDKFLTSLLYPPQHLPSVQVHSDPRALFPSHTLFSSSHFTHTHSPQQSLTNSHTVCPTPHSHRNPSFYLLTSHILILTLDQSTSVSGPVSLSLPVLQSPNDKISVC